MIKTGTAIEPTPSKSWDERVWDAVTGGSIGAALHAGGNVDLAALDKNYTPGSKRPMVKPSELFGGGNPQTLAEGAGLGLLEGLDTFATPEGVAMIAGLGKLSKVPAVGKAAVTAIGAGFDADMIHGAIQEVPEAKKLWEEGNHPEAARVAVKAALSGGLGLAGARAKIREGIGAGAAKAEPGREGVIQEAAAGAGGKESLQPAPETPTEAPAKLPASFVPDDPKVAAAVLVEKGGRVLLTQRAGDPQQIFLAEMLVGPEALAQRGAVLVLHHQVAGAVRLEILQHRHDIRVLEPRQQQRLGQVVLDFGARAADRLEDLHGLPAHEAMPNAIHLGEGTFAEQTFDLVCVADLLTRR